MNDPLHDSVDALSKAYEKMHQRAVSNLHQAKEKSAQILHQFIHQAKDKAVALEELTEEDAAKVADWLKRDMDDFIDSLVEGENELKDWLGFETSLLENVFLDLMLQTADKTTVELLALKENVRCCIFTRLEESPPVQNAMRPVIIENRINSRVSFTFKPVYPLSIFGRGVMRYCTD